MTTSLPATNGPVLRFHPVEGSEPFAEKQLPLASGERVKIGRQCNDATEAKADNGFFDTKVLSRQHAEVWADGLQIFIKDTKSFNGTYVNGKRLSDEAVESAPVELKSGDVVVFGIDVVDEDKTTILHHKAAARVECIIPEAK